MDRTPARLALAEAAIEAAFRLRPDAGEAHLARAGHFIADTWIMPERLSRTGNCSPDPAQ